MVGRGENMDNIKIRFMTDEQLGAIIRTDCEASPYIPTDLINDYLATMSVTEKEWDEFVWEVVEELVERRKKNLS